ncbi:MAG: hypothetical protein KAH12_07605 [Anaerolineales bacterium]|nr:hypothetical protein [Anaerolineales bacterium]
MTKRPSLIKNLRVKNNVSFILFLSTAIALITTVVSGLGFLLPDMFYPAPGLVEQYLANDLVNIILGLPLFIAALVLLRRGKLLGLLLLPGALIYVIYNYVGYALGRPWDWISIINLGLVILSLIALVLLLKAMDHQAVMEILEGKVGEKAAGLILVIFGLAFIALAVSTIITGIQEGAIPPLGKNAVSIADILVSLGWVGGGILLLRKMPLGFSTGLGLLVAASFLFLGLILFFFLAPLVTDRAFDWIEVITVLAMGLVCFIPTGLFWRGIVTSTSTFHIKEKH